MFNSNKIRQKCDERKITQKELASRLGITPHGLNKMLSNNEVKATLLDKIADILEVQAGYFFDSGGNNNVYDNPKVFLAFELNEEQKDKVIKLVVGKEFINFLKQQT